MEVRVDYYIDLGDLGEMPVEIKADVTEGDRDAPTCMQGTDVDIWQIVLPIGGQRIDITNQAMTNARLKQAFEDQVLETFYEARTEALAYRAHAYRHVDCRA